MAKSRSKNQAGTPSSITPRTIPGQGLIEAAATAPHQDRIAARAYELYVARGSADGLALEDWLAAERELSQETRRERES